MKYEYKDTFIKTCSSNNGVGECERSRESVKCVDNVCTKVSNPKNKKEILEEHYKSIVQDGAGPDPKLQLKKKHRCPFCKEYKHIGSLIEHINTHKGKEKQHKFQAGGCAACMMGGGMIGGADTVSCPFCKKGITLESLIKHIRTHKEQKMKNLVGGCAACMIGGKKQFYGKKSSVMVKVPVNVKRTAVYAFKLRKLGFKGGKETGIKRMKQLATKESIPIEDLKYMRAWFARHIYASYPSYKLWQKAGRPKDSKWHNKHGVLSWILWAGDAGFKWVNSTKSLKLLNKHYPGKNYTKIKIPKA